MYLKKLFYKITNKDKHFFYKNSLKRDNHEKIIKRIYDSEIHNKIENIHNAIKNKKELSFSHCGHLGDVINSLPTVKKLSKNHKCNFFIHTEKALEDNAKNYKGFGDTVYLKNKTVDMLMPLFANLPYIEKTEKLKNHVIDIDFNLIRKSFNHASLLFSIKLAKREIL